MTVPVTGRTVLAHVQELLTEATVVLAEARVMVDGKLKPAQREDLRRKLAGVIGSCETVRIWLDAGAPR
jgi:hypothetical protein